MTYSTATRKNRGDAVIASLKNMSTVSRAHVDVKNRNQETLFIRFAGEAIRADFIDITLTAGSDRLL
jgi:hypothetical protein